MHIDLVNHALKPIEYLQILNECEQRLFFFVLDYISDHIFQRGYFPPQEVLDSLTDKSHITSYVWNYIQQQSRETLRQKVAAINAWKPLFLAIPPGQATGRRISASAPVKKTEAPLGGTPLLDGKVSMWQDRLQEKSSTYDSEASGPLISNYHEARQIRAEYASLEFRVVPYNRGLEFCNDIEEQKQLVGELYDAIMNMEDILEGKKSVPPKNTINTGGLNTDGIKATTETNKTTTQRKKRSASELECGTEDNTNQESQTIGDEDLRDRINVQPQQPSRTNIGPKQPKESISVIKVKSLSRIEVEMLSWEILYTIRDVDRGQLPFMSWSGRDWSWDAQFSTFRERFEAVATTLRRSKAAVCSLLESDYMARLAAHPRREYRRKENNRSQNAERNAQVFVGRHAIGTGQVQVGSTGDLQDREGNVVAAAGAVHNSLIEQTRKLGEMSRRDTAAKKARLTPNAAVDAVGAELNTGAIGKEVFVAPVKRKLRVQRQKPDTKASAFDNERKMKESMSAVGSSLEEIDFQQPLRVILPRASTQVLNRTPSPVSSMTTAMVSTGAAGFISLPVTPSAWSRVKSAGFCGNPYQAADVDNSCSDSINVSHSTPHKPNNSRLNTITNTLTSTTGSLGMPSPSVSFDLSFSPALMQSMADSAETCSQGLARQQRVSPDSIDSSSLEDISKLLDTSISKCSSNDSTLDDMATFFPEVIAEESTNAMLSKWDLEDQWNAIQQLDCVAFDPTAPSAGLDLCMDMDMSSEYCIFPPDLWATQTGDNFDQLLGDNVSTLNARDSLG